MDPRGLDEIARRYGIRLILQFGSTVRGQARPDSDLDVGVLFDRVPPGLSELGALAADLQALAPGREVDLAVLNRADPLFLKKILEHSVLLHGSPRRLAELQMYAFRRYQDHRRFLKMERDFVRAALAARR